MRACAAPAVRVTGLVIDERQKLATARLGAPYGVRGFQAVRTYSGDTEHLFRLAEVELRESRSGRLRTAAVAAYAGSETRW